MPSTAIDRSRFTAVALRHLADDDRHLHRVQRELAAQQADLDRRIAALRTQRHPAGHAMLERDLEIHELARRRRSMQRLGLEACLGRLDLADGTTRYVGRLGLREGDGEQLLVDWRTAAAEPFFAATLAEPMGVRRRRRFRWLDGRVIDCWDEWLDLTAPQESTGLQDAQSAFLAALAADRSGRMSSVLGTIQADQDAIIRADPAGCTVVEGGPGTGKTVVALHRAAFVAFTRQASVLYVTKSAQLTHYVRDVLPSLGEDDVPVATLGELFADVATRSGGPVELSRLKGSVAMAEAIERAIAFFQGLPRETLVAELPDRDVVVRPADWREALDSCSETGHRARRFELLVALEELLSAPGLRRDESVIEALSRSWPLLSAPDLVGDLLSHRGLLRHAAPELSADEVELVLNDSRAADGWHVDDLPLLDHARQLLGSPGLDRNEVRELALRRAHAAKAIEAARTHATAGTGVEMLSERQVELLEPLTLEPAGALGERVFAHVVVDEAQDLTAMEWLAVLRRCTSRSLTIVGDLAQAREGFTQSWQSRRAEVGLTRPHVCRLRVSYRTPQVLLEPAVRVIRAVRPDVDVPEAIRTDGEPLVVEQLPADADLVAAGAQRAVDLLRGSGTAALVVHASRPPVELPEAVGRHTPDELKGLEMDVVVIVEPAELWPNVSFASSAYVTLTRATRAVVVLHQRPLPAVLQPAVVGVSQG